LCLAGDDLKLDRILELYDELGPIPHLCIIKMCLPNALETHRQQLSRALADVTNTRLQDMISWSGGLSMDAVSSTICLIRRVDRENVASGFRTHPITHSIGARICARIQMLTSQERVQLYHSLSYLPSTRAMAGKVFEPFCQLRFQSRIRIELIPMVRLPDPKPEHTATASKKRRGLGGAADTHRAPRPQCHSSHRALHDEELETMRRAALCRKVYLDIRPLETREFTDDDLTRMGIVPDVYYIPNRQNQVGLDAFIVHRGILYILQFTVGHGHGIKDGLLAFLAKCQGLPSRANWRFIFVVPGDVDVLTCPVPHLEELQNLSLYSSVVAVEEERGMISFLKSFLPW
jgi:hypothetical protein